MAGVSLIDLIVTLREGRLLEPEPLDEVTDHLVRQLFDPAELLAELARRGWLTAFQAEWLRQGRGRELQMGPYLLLDRLGDGGLGPVYKARIGRQKRLAVLKVFRPE